MFGLKFRGEANLLVVTLKPFLNEVHFSLALHAYCMSDLDAGLVPLHMTSTSPKDNRSMGTEAAGPLLIMMA